MRPPQRQHLRKALVLASSGEEGIAHLGEFFRPAFALVLDIELEAAGIAQPEDRRRRESQHQRLANTRSGPHHLADHLLDGFLALVPVARRDENRRRAVAETTAEEIQAGKGDHVLDRGVLADDRVDLLDHRLGTRQRRAVGQVHRADVITLILVRHQAAGRELPQRDRGGDHQKVDRQRHQRAPHEEFHAALVMPGHAGEAAVEGAEEASRLVRFFAFQQRHAECRRQRQRDDARNHHRDGDRHGKLPVEFASESAQEGDRNEHRAQHQHDRDHRPGDLAHRQQRGFARLLAFLVDDALDVLQHHDGIVDHDADREHHAEQRQRIDRIAEQQQADEGAQKRHRHGENGDERRAPVLQEHEHHQHHQQDRLAQRLHHLADRHLDEACGVVGHGIVETFREALLQFLDRARDLVADLERVGAGLQENAHQRRRLAVVEAGEVVVLGAEFDPRHILQVQQRAVRVGTHHDALEFLRIGESPLGGERIHQRLAIVDRRLANLAGSELRVLLVDRASEITHRHAKLRHTVGLQPDAHGVILGAEDLHVGRARDTLQPVQHVERDIVAGEEIVVAAVWREEGKHLQESRRALLHRHALASHFFRQSRLGLLDAVVDVERSLVDVGTDLEGDLDFQNAVGGGGRRHVHHVLDAVDRVLQRRRDGLLQHSRRRARIDRTHRHHRRRDLRILGDRQYAHRQQAGEHDENGQHDREDRPVDEKAREHVGPLRFRCRRRCVCGRRRDRHAGEENPRHAVDNDLVSGLQPFLDDPAPAALPGLAAPHPGPDLDRTR